MSMYQRILVATDGTPLSDKAVASAIDLAALCGAELVAVQVVHRYPMAYFDGGIALESEDVQRVEKSWADAAQVVVDGVQRSAQVKGVKAQAMVVRSDVVSDALLAAAKQQHCDLIVMASHGRRGLQRLLLGSETQHVLTHSHIPVLVLR